MRLTDREEGPHHDHRDVVLPGIAVVVAREAHVVRVHGRELGVDDVETAAQFKRHEEGDHRRHDHEDALDQVGEHDRADAARHAVENHGDAHDGDPDPFGRARVGREDHAAADRLRAHHRDEEDEHEDGEKPADAGRFIAVREVVGHCEHLVAVAERDEPATDEKRGDEHREGDARHRDGHPGVAHVVDRAWHAHEGRHGVLGREVGDARKNGPGLPGHREEVGKRTVFLRTVPAETRQNETVENDDGEKRPRHADRVDGVLHQASSSSNS